MLTDDDLTDIEHLIDRGEEDDQHALARRAPELVAEVRRLRGVERAAMLYVDSIGDPYALEALEQSLERRADDGGRR